MHTWLENCQLCPRNCGVNRLQGEKGFCQGGRDPKLARVSLHHWEEPCISGSKGSGTVFFSNCNLKCVFCQNHLISQEGVGKKVSVERLAEIFMEQQERGAHNINLVTPTHYVPQIITALDWAKKAGLSIPILYNTNGYENIETIQSLQGYIDVYLPDLKYFADEYAQKYSLAPNYFQYASAAIKEMFHQVGKPQFDDHQLMTKGVIIRHLVLPGLTSDSKKVLDYIAQEFGEDVFISMMNQYIPMHQAEKFNEINKPLDPREYDEIIDYCVSVGLTKGFIQEEGANSENFVPEFDLRGISK